MGLELAAIVDRPLQLGGVLLHLAGRGGQRRPVGLGVEGTGGALGVGARLAGGVELEGTGELAWIDPISVPSNSLPPKSKAPNCLRKSPKLPAWALGRTRTIIRLMAAVNVLLLIVVSPVAILPITFFGIVIMELTERQRAPPSEAPRVWSAITPHKFAPCGSPSAS